MLAWAKIRTNNKVKFWLFLFESNFSFAWAIGLSLKLKIFAWNKITFSPVFNIQNQKPQTTKISHAPMNSTHKNTTIQAIQSIKL